MQIKTLRIGWLIKKDYSDGFRKNIYFSINQILQKKMSRTFRLKVNWVSDSETTYKFLVSEVESR